MQPMLIGENVLVAVSDDHKTATITVDLEHRGDVNDKGNTRVANSAFVPLPGTDVRLSVNAIVKGKRR